MQTIFHAALIVAAILCLSDLIVSTARFAQSLRRKRHAERDVLGRRWLPIPELGFGMCAFCCPGLVTLGLTHHNADNLPTLQILLAALVFGYAGAVLSRVVRTPGPGGRRFKLRAGLLLGLPAVFGLVFGLSGIAV
ncbi:MULTISPECIES: hypothetical protein [Kribbella]|uniref:DUF2182 domain-containing protein n=1 Tax=Kribbella pratensis TaxID=2512112 RepID=A0ABY2FML0_9ACTN|nr:MULTISPECIES: hypothetical protein [Kribbella]TDW94371.1 hypothetical protein EV137_1675 [Kribbella pratensis]TDX02977.1 hypothetical protein EV647_1198 [Kribbella sp. VKM Ac-2566]